MQNRVGQLIELIDSERAGSLASMTALKKSVPDLKSEHVMPTCIVKISYVVFVVFGCINDLNRCILWLDNHTSNNNRRLSIHR